MKREYAPFSYDNDTQSIFFFPRWFFDGCCECVGSTCINYGLKDSRCSQCPDTKDVDLLDEVPQDDFDFGENHLDTTI